MEASPPRHVLILGATSAVAHAVASRLAGRGDRLYLVGRDRSKLASMRSELGDAIVGTEALDFTAGLRDGTNKAHRAVVQRATQTLGSLHAALLAHGWLASQAETQRQFGLAQDTLQINLSSVIAFLLPLADHFERQRRGSIVAITSVAGDRGRPRNYTYGAAKGGLQRYLEGLRSRLVPAGVKVVDIRLGPVDTPMTVDHRKNAAFTTPDAIAPAIVSALDRGDGVMYLPRFWRAVMWVVRNLPEPVFQRLRFLSGP